MLYAVLSPYAYREKFCPPLPRGRYFGPSFMPLIQKVWLHLSQGELVLRFFRTVSFGPPSTLSFIWCFLVHKSREDYQTPESTLCLTFMIILNFNRSGYCLYVSGPYDTAKALLDAYNAGSLRKFSFPKGYRAEQFAKTVPIRSGDLRENAEKPPSTTYDPEGPRYKIHDHTIRYLVSNQEWFRPSVICLTKCTFF